MAILFAHLSASARLIDMKTTQELIADLALVVEVYEAAWAAGNPERPQMKRAWRTALRSLKEAEELQRLGEPQETETVAPSYSERVDPVVYGHGTDGFEQADWLRLALAALDQGRAPRDLYERVRRLVDDVGG
jgi:hypothetical protein